MRIQLFMTLAMVLFATALGAKDIATVNGKAISEDELNAVLMEGTQGRFETLDAAKQKELKTRVLDGLITQQLIFEDALKNGITKSKEYQDELKVIMQRAEEQLAAKLWQKAQFDKLKVTEKEIKAYYDSHKAEFIEKEKVHARHILVKTEAEAKAIIAELASLSGDALKSKFISLATTKSTGPSASKGGDLGTFPQGQMVPEFNDAVFSMKKGTITKSPVKTQFGYHIIYLEDKLAGKTLSFDEVKSYIEKKLKFDQFKVTTQKKIQALKDAAKITYNK